MNDPLADETSANAANAAAAPQEVAPPRPIPGAEVIGRGVKVYPRSPYELKDYMLQRGEAREVSTGFGRFLCPDKCEVHESPPVHQGVALGKTVVVETSEQLDAIYALDQKVAAGFGAFSISAGVDYSKSVATSTDSRFAVRTSFVPTWAIYMPRHHPEAVVTELDAKLSRDRDTWEPGLLREGTNRNKVAETRDYFQAIFDEYGTHYITRVWVGGKATVNVIVEKSANIEADDLRMGLQASWSVLEADLTDQQKATRKRLLNNSQVVVWGAGGHTSLLAKLGSLEDTYYNEWLDSVEGNPDVIEMELKGIWTLLPRSDENLAQALRTAYDRATNFDHMRTLCTTDWPPKRMGPRKRAATSHAKRRPKATTLLYIVRENQNRFALDLNNVSQAPAKKPLYGRSNCPLQRTSPFKPIDAALRLPLAPRLKEDPHFEKECWSESRQFLYFFGEQNYFVYDDDFRKMFQLNPKLDYDPFTQPKKFTRPQQLVLNHLEKRVNEGDKGPWFDKRFLAELDAKLNGEKAPTARQITDLAKRDVLVRNSEPKWLETSRPIQPLPETKSDWPGMTFPKLDAAVFWPPDKVYFFYLSQYIRFDVEHWRADDGYPRDTRERWAGVPFERIDAAVRLGDTIYLFRLDEYVAYSMETCSVNPNYPKYLVGSYVENWEFLAEPATYTKPTKPK